MSHVIWWSSRCGNSHRLPNNMRKRNADKPPVEDDGRTIADMDLEGMPWRRGPLSRKKPRFASPPPDLTPQERRAAIRGMLKAVFLIGAAFLVMFFLLLLFLDLFWLR